MGGRPGAARHPKELKATRYVVQGFADEEVLLGGNHVVRCRFRPSMRREDVVTPDCQVWSWLPAQEPGGRGLGSRNAELSR